MNRSGRALASLLADPGFAPARDLLVLVDDVAIPVGTFRLRARGSAGGHNGLKSIEGTLHSPEYARLRIGVGPTPADATSLSDYVLFPFDENQATSVRALLPTLVEAVECWLVDGIDEAMNRFNQKGKPSE